MEGLKQRVFKSLLDEFLKNNIHYFKETNPIYDEISKKNTYSSKGSSVDFNVFDNGGLQYVIYNKIYTYTKSFWGKEIKTLSKTVPIFCEIDEQFPEDLELESVDEPLIKELKNIRSRYEEIKQKLREEFKEELKNILKELDKDNNGEIDVVEGNDFNLLLKKHQKKIVEIDKNYVQQFVKVSGYLKTQKTNIQLIFNELHNDKVTKSLKFNLERNLSIVKKVKEEFRLDSIKESMDLVDKHIKEGKDIILYETFKSPDEILDNINILKNYINSYNVLLFNSLSMVVSLIEGDMITFYEIYESFDKLNMFNSNWENEVSRKLSDIGDGLSDLLFSVNEIGQNIINEIGNLSYVTEQSNEILSNRLKEIDSSIKTNNLLSTIQTYQLYKINKTNT